MQVATLVRADWLFLLTDVDSLYTANPSTHPKAVAIHQVHDLNKLKVNPLPCQGIPVVPACSSHHNSSAISICGLVETSHGATVCKWHTATNLMLICHATPFGHSIPNGCLSAPTAWAATDHMTWYTTTNNTCPGSGEQSPSCSCFERNLTENCSCSCKRGLA